MKRLSIILCVLFLCGGCAQSTTVNDIETSASEILSEDILMSWNIRDYQILFPTKLDVDVGVDEITIRYSTDKNNPAFIKFYSRDLKPGLKGKIYTDEFVNAFVEPMYEEFKDLWIGKIEIKETNGCQYLIIPYSGEHLGYDLFGNIRIYYQEGDDYFIMSSESESKGDYNYSSEFNDIAKSFCRR